MRRGALAALAAALAFPATAAATPLQSAFAPNDPLAPRQWYLGQDHAYDFWPAPPVLPPVRVGVVDSGVDGTNPDLKGQIVAHKSFVGGSALVDTQGHGTFVAGEIAAATNNGVGIAGVAFSAQLVIAKVVAPGGTITTGAEAAGIRWAVDQNVRVINLSIGGLRDPADPTRDTYSPVEAAAIQYAVRHNVVVVAAVGNADEAPSEPWPYASYPAALPHVLGVSALDRNGSVPIFSNRDAVYNDIAAPGIGILSTFPLALTAQRPACADQGYSDCGPPEYAGGEGTSFAAPQVAGAAALLIAVHPQLSSDQVTTILERSADDMTPATGCQQCTVGRDAYTGWGRLDIAQALVAAESPPPADHYEPNDNAGTNADPIGAGVSRIHATIDYWDDPIDVYRLRLVAGERFRAQLATGAIGGRTSLQLWKPGTQNVIGVRGTNLRAAAGIARGQTTTLADVVNRTGYYYVEVHSTTPGFGPYTLTLRR